MPGKAEIPSEEQKIAETSPPTYQTLYSEVHLSENTEDTLLFNKSNYKISISVGPMANKMPPVNSFSDTRAKQTIIREDFIEAKSLEAIQASYQLALSNASTQKVSIVETISLHVKMDDS